MPGTATTVLISVKIGSVGTSPQVGELKYNEFVTLLTVLPCPVLSCPVLFLDPAPRSNRWTDFYALWLKRRVSVQGGAFWGLQ